MTDRAALLAAAAAVIAELPDVVAGPADGGTAWSRSGTRFAVLAGASVDIRIGATIAAAALRTPDVAASARGSDWVAFAPRELDGHALDRLGAWLVAAHRRAVGRGDGLAAG
ncbi:MAG: hypothetical protein AB1736_07085 [Chloroflexota bacterium]